MKEISIIAQNRVGAVADVAEALGKVGINIKTIMAMGSDETAVINVITEDVTSAKKALEKAGMNPRVGEILLLSMRDRPGELAKILRKLAVAGVDLESVYIAGRTGNGEVEVAVKPDSVAKARAALKK
ncbi:MAG: ACT domain-containing protein [Candidatus ainarchaeum sp.]|nr:ACT domain-containing protein [Candidatus ainarchaeum sp.]